jgi:hypothetical protein
MQELRLPMGKQFAFTIFDDTDVATVENVTPIYRLLERLGMRTTKTVWPLGCPEGSSAFWPSQTLEDRPYRDFVVDLQERGFEIGWHGATMETSDRGRTIRGLDVFRETFGRYPRVMANHSRNRENLYWGRRRIDNPLISSVFGRLRGVDRGHFQGDVEGSPFWWGDFCQEHIVYARNLTFNEINVLRVNPTLPYHDPRRPLVPWWFSGSEARSRKDFDALLSPERQDRLEEEGGICIVATHLGLGFGVDGAVPRTTRERLEMLAQRDGWFPTTGELLDWLRDQGQNHVLGRFEWQRMQWRWARDRAMTRARHWHVSRVKRTRRSSRDEIPVQGTEP